MTSINSLAEIMDSISRIREMKKGYITSFFPDPDKIIFWISKGLLFSYDVNETKFFLRRNSTFLNVYFCSTGLSDLNEAIKKIISETDDILVFDVIGPEKSQADLKGIFRDNGLYHYCRLQRMSRMINEVGEVSHNNYIRCAFKDEIEKIMDIFGRHFDEYAEQIPLAEEISDWISKGHLLVYDEGFGIIGFVIFDLNGLTSYLRYWFVDPAYRDRKMGSNLLRQFFYESRNSKRQLFWVIDTNENAIKRYEHYGFRSENLFDDIYINLNKKYEGRNN